jgi:hypothetical protein
MDEMKALADFGRDLDREPPAALLRQRNRLLDALGDGDGKGRAIRRRTNRRLRFGLAGAATVLTAGTALIAGTVFTAAVPAPHHTALAVPPPTGITALAGWSVKTEAGGKVQVSLRELTDAGALRRALASAHVPARVWLVPVEVSDPKTFGALAAPIVGCTPDYLLVKRLEGPQGVDGLEFPAPDAARGVVFQIDPSAMPADTVVNIILYTLKGEEGGYYIAVTKSADNACTPYEN